MYNLHAESFVIVGVTLAGAFPSQRLGPNASGVMSVFGAERRLGFPLCPARQH